MAILFVGVLCSNAGSDRFFNKARLDLEGCIVAKVRSVGNFDTK